MLFASLAKKNLASADACASLPASPEGLSAPALLVESTSNPEPPLESHPSALSGPGVPEGEFWLLSTRLCRLPDLGVMLLLRKPDTGDTYSSFADEFPGWVLLA